MNQSDYSMIEYYWEKRQDLDEYVDREDIKRAQPVLCRAYADFKHALAVVEMVIKSMDVTYED